MFYGSDDMDTAIQETIDPTADSGKMFTGGSFVSTVPLIVLDLCSLPSMSSFFNDWDESQRNGLYFLQAFQKDLAKPIKKDGRQHIEYIPTQVFTEYVRFEVKSANGESYDGIRYPSSKTGKPCVALFLDQDDCLPDILNREQMLALEPASVVTKQVQP